MPGKDMENKISIGLAIVLLIFVILMVNFAKNDEVVNSTVSTVEDVEENTVNVEDIVNIETVEEDIILPISSTIDINNLENECVAVSFNNTDIEIENGTIYLTIYSKDFYNADDIKNLTNGSKVLFDGKIYEVKTVVFNGDFVDINGGIGEEEFGMSLRMNDNGNYTCHLFNDYATYTKLGTVQLHISDDFTLDDYIGGNPDNNGRHTDKLGLGEYLTGLEEVYLDFTELTTLATIKNNEVVNINRRWVP